MISKLVMQKLTIAGKEYEYPDTTALVEKINELADAVNGILDYAPLEMAMKAEKPNIDIGELAYLQKENGDLKDELERTCKALDVAKYAIKNIKNDMKKVKDGDDIWEIQKNLHDYCKTTIKKITALEQKDVK